MPATSATSTAVAAVTAAADKLHTGVAFSDNVFFVEDIKRGEGNVGDFLLTKSDLVVVSEVRQI
jgi:hypothetical protein